MCYIMNDNVFKNELCYIIGATLGKRDSSYYVKVVEKYNPPGKSRSCIYEAVLSERQYRTFLNICKSNIYALLYLKDETLGGVSKIKVKYRKKIKSLL